MKIKLTPYQQEILEIYSLLNGSQNSISAGQKKWFKILEREADFTDHYNLHMTQNQMKVWRDIFTSLKEKAQLGDRHGTK